MTTQTIGYDQTLSVNNVDLSYNDVGSGDVPVIFLHGFPFDKTMWQDQLAFLNTTERVIAVDIRGFGKSKDEESPLSIGLFGDDLIAFMDALKIESAIICGLSMGGFVALNVASRFPNRVAALILCDTQCIADSNEVKEKRYTTIEQIQNEGVTAFNDAFIKSVFHENTLSSHKELVKTLRDVVFANSHHIIKAGLIALAERGETCSTLNKISVPSLIICGRQDIVTPLEESEFLLKNILGSELHIIENAGHVSNLEHPNDFNKLLSAFLTHFKKPGSNKSVSTTTLALNDNLF